MRRKINLFVLLPLAIIILANWSGSPGGFMAVLFIGAFPLVVVFCWVKFVKWAWNAGSRKESE